MGVWCFGIFFFLENRKRSSFCEIGYVIDQRIFIN